jgi:hypothetical protein
MFTAALFPRAKLESSEMPNIDEQIKKYGINIP